MKFIALFRCWLWGHEADDNISGFLSVIDVDLNISSCKYCGSTIIWDDNIMGWVKW
jgi:hypothetical protein